MDKTLVVKGIGKLAVSPDTIQLDLHLSEVYEDYEVCMKKSNEKLEGLRNALVSANFKKEDLKTKHFNINTEYESYHDDNGNWKQVFKGYRYNHDMNLKFDNDNELLGTVLKAIANSNIPVEFSINHTVKDVEKVKNDLLTKAIEDASDKAKVLAEAAKVTLEEIINIDYSYKEINIVSQPMSYMKTCEESLDTDSYGMDLEVEDIDLKDTVTVVWRIS